VYLLYLKEEEGVGKPRVQDCSCRYLVKYRIDLAIVGALGKHCCNQDQLKGKPY